MQGQWNHDEAYYRCRNQQEYALANTLDQLYEAQNDQPGTTDDVDIEAVVRDCDEKLARYRQALEAGADPALVAAWTADVQTRKAQALVRKRSHRQQQRMSKAEIEALVDQLCSIHAIISAADPNDKAEIYRRLNLRLTYQPEDRLVRAETTLHSGAWSSGECPRGDLNPHPLYGD